MQTIITCIALYDTMQTLLYFLDAPLSNIEYGNLHKVHEPEKKCEDSKEEERERTCRINVSL